MCHVARREFAGITSIVRPRLGRHRSAFILFIVLAYLLGPHAADLRGQSDNPLETIGVPPFSAMLPVENGSINAANGNLHLEIPLASVPQRGGPPLKVSLTYDSSIWNFSQCCSPQSGIFTHGEFDIGGTFTFLTGWQLITSSNGSGGGSSVGTDEYICSQDGLPRDLVVDYFTWASADGTTHAFPMYTVFPEPTSCNTWPLPSKPSADGFALDGSGYHMFVTSWFDTQVFAPDGTLVYGNSRSPTEYPIDTNGNYYTNGATDTLGRPVVTITQSGSNIIFNVLNTQSGGTSTFTASTQNQNVHTNFGSLCLCTDYNGPLDMITGITLPDGTSYSFGYDTAMTGTHYGQLTSMTLPTGGNISYSYANFIDSEYYPNGSAGVHISRGVSQRVTPNGTSGYNLTANTSCTYSSPLNCTQSYTVTKPSTDKTVYTFALNGGAWPTEVDYYTGGSTLLATTTQCFSYLSTCPNYNPAACPTPGITVGEACGIPGTSIYVMKTQDTTTLPGPVSTTNQYTWDTTNYYGNLKIKKEWNFGSSLSNNPDRTITTNYLSGSSYIASSASPTYINIANRPTSITVTNGSGVTVTQTVNTYDDWATSGGTGLINHDDPNFSASVTARGNLTQAKQLLNPGGSFVTTVNHYDIAGNLIQTTDPNGNTTSFDYTDNFYGISPSPPTSGYVTKITRPVVNGINHTERTQYYFGAGLPAAKCGENFASASSCAYGLSAPQPDYSSFTYDNMERPLTLNAGDGGLTTWAYGVSPSTVTATSKINSTQSLISESIEDGLGRTIQTQTSSGRHGLCGHHL